jgi:hypothetical protein
MQGGQEPGRGVYLARRIVAALIVLLLLVFLVPRACQAFLGPAEESNTVAPEKSVTEEETTSETAGTPARSEIGEQASPGQSARSSTVVVESEEAENQEGDLEASLDLSNTIGQVNQEAAPVPAFDAAQQAVQPLPSGQPALRAEQPVAVGPVLPTEPVAPILPAEQPVPPTEPIEPSLPAQPIVAGPTLPAEPVIAEPTLPVEPMFLNKPLFLEVPASFEEEPVFEGTSREAIATAPEPSTVAQTNSGGGAVAAAGPVSARA